jgi:two-component system, OmpR family, response regulator RegX3
MTKVKTTNTVAARSAAARVAAPIRPGAQPRQGEAVKVLVAEDEESFVEALVVGLAREGFEVTVAKDGGEALALFDRISPDLVLLDIMLPKLSGIDVCRAIRTRSSVPIIMVTAKGTEIDTVVGLEVGADDYVAKPYRLRELVARMRAVLRRSGSETGQAEEGGSERSVVEVGDVRVDADRHRVYVRGIEVALRRKEFELLLLLIENAGRVLTRDTLIDRVWGSDYVGDTKTLDVHVKRLRHHLEPDPSSPSIITTVRGVGYRFEVPAKG